MADVFLASRANIPGATAGNGDDIYLTSSNEVFDVVNNKLKVVPGISVRISSSLWAVFNQAKSFNLGSGVIHDKTNAYRKGAIVTRSGSLFQANAAVPVNTDFKIGTTGATWSIVGAKAQELIIGGITPTAAARYG